MIKDFKICLEFIGDNLMAECFNEVLSEYKNGTFMTKEDIGLALRFYIILNLERKLNRLEIEDKKMRKQMKTVCLARNEEKEAANETNKRGNSCRAGQERCH